MINGFHENGNHRRAEEGNAGQGMPRHLRESPRHARPAAPSPREDAIQKDQVRERRDEIADQALAIPPEPIKLRGRIAPAVSLPGFSE